MRLFAFRMASCKELEDRIQDLKRLNYEELLQKAIHRERRVFELENTLAKLHTGTLSKEGLRPFDFSRYKKRHVALQIAYLGWNYSGIALQNPSQPVTVMERVMQSLERCRLVENRNVGLTICGRTDKGVSAVGQVLSVVLRSAVNCGVGVINDSGPNIDQRPGSTDTEIDYVLLLNRVLPHDIRVLAWSPVSEDFNARFTCLQRSYSYYFPLSGLDLSAMQDAASRLEGTHDFRNFCSNQVESDCVTFVRRIDRVAVEMLVADSSSATTLCSVSVSASGFLYHQIRYMMSVLIRIGRGYETPALIDEMLDIEKTPAKPQYYMAADFPLLLTGAQYPDGAVKWQTSEAAGLNLIKHFQTLWADHTIRAATVKTMLDHVERCFPHYPPLLHYLDRIIPEGRWRDCSGSPYKGPFKPMMKRSVELSVEEKLDRFKRKKEKSEAGDSLNQENLNRDTDT